MSYRRAMTPEPEIHVVTVIGEGAADVKASDIGIVFKESDE